MSNSDREARARLNAARVASYQQLSGEDRIREVFKQYAALADNPEYKEWSALLFPSLAVHSVSPLDAPHPSVTFSFTVQEQHCNGVHQLHGGCTATIFDVTTSIVLSLVSRPGYWSYLGASRTMNTSYLRPAPVGTKVLIHCEIAQIGQRFVFLRGTMCRANGDGALIATCEHHKFNNDPQVTKV